MNRASKNLLSFACVQVEEALFRMEIALVQSAACEFIGAMGALEFYYTCK